ncbi:MAG TPA: STAS domain-containing protein [Caldilineae bacterium]|nr:STAS domain-containing protein [Caldilineae bacterium]
MATRPILTPLASSASYFTRPVRILRDYKIQNLRPDLIAGLTLSVLVLPQGIAFAFIAGLPPQMGLYAGIVGAIVGGLWGSSHHLHTGATNTASLLVASVLIPIAAQGSPEYIAAAGMLAVMVGVFRVLVGVARLGVLANFVSDSVIVGFTAGAGILIAVGQMRHLLRVNDGGSTEMVTRLENLIIHAPETHLITLALGGGAIVLLILLRRFFPKLPGPLIVMVLGAAIVAVFGLDQQGVRITGELPRSLPPLASLPIFNLNLISDLSMGALALGAIGLVEATSIARSIAARSGQRLESNQEFVGQGLASLASGLFSGYSTSASFNRSAANYDANAQTGLAAAFSGIFALIAMLALAPAAAYIPLAVLAGVLIVIGLGMIDVPEMVRIWRSTRGDTAIMLVTLFATLFLPLQFAVLTGILMSLAYYLLKTSMPVVLPVFPDDAYKHLEPRPGKPQCPQLAVLEVRGDLYFGAVGHVEDAILENMQKHPHQRYLTLRMQNVQHIDISGIHVLESIVRHYRELGGDVYISKVRPAVQKRMEAAGFVTLLGEDHFLEVDEAIPFLFQHVLDPAICIYECEIRAFLECQNLPRPDYHLDLPGSVEIDESKLRFITAKALHHRLAQPDPPLVVDVREPREFKRGHIPQAINIPLPQLVTRATELKANLSVVLVCRTGRRSHRVAQALCDQNCTGVQILEGGMLNWEAANLLVAIEF